MARETYKKDRYDGEKVKELLLGMIGSLPGASGDVEIGMSVWKGLYSLDIIKKYGIFGNLSGLEYLSSIILLSRCTALVGGNCGGTLGALFFNDEKYEFVHVFNLGLYP